MNDPIHNPLSDCARNWAIAMTERPSVTGTLDEISFGPWLAEQLCADANFAGAEIWTELVAGENTPACVFMLIQGKGRGTVILTGHYDTVSIADYGDLKGLAIQPGALLQGLRARLDKRADTASEQRAKADFVTDDFLPGRGFLDMKAGLAAGLAVATHFAQQDAAQGNLLFIAVPDEESNSSGARCAAKALPAISINRDLDLLAAINLDAIADDADGSSGRVIALGTVGKVLPTAFVAGIATHSGFPLNGLNAATLAAAIARRIEWARELTDETTSQPGTPPSLLSLHDGKMGYDVTTPATAWATWNVLTLRRTPNEVLDAFDALCAEAADAYLADLQARAKVSRMPDGVAATVKRILVHRYATVLEKALATDPTLATELAALRATLATAGLTLPEQCRRMTDHVWRASGMPGPAIVTGFGSTPYLATNLSDSGPARRLEEVAQATAAASTDRYGTAIACVPYFAGISDMSFFGEADEAALDVVAQNTPMWSAPRGSGQSILGNVPTINIGPWGRDYHTPLERMHVGYGFEVLPRVLRDVVAELLG